MLARLKEGYTGSCHRHKQHDHMNSVQYGERSNSLDPVMCDDDSRLIIDDNEVNYIADDATDGLKGTPDKNYGGADPNMRRSVSPSSSSSSSSSSTSSSSNSSTASFPLNNGQQLDNRPEKQPIQKRKKEDIKTTPRKTNENVVKTAEADNVNKKQKVGPPRSTANKHCQTDDLQQQPLKPDSNVLLDITIVFAPDPNTLYFTTKWKGRAFHGVISDGLSSKNQLYALKRERAERLNGGGKSSVQNGQSLSSLKRGKRALNRGAIDHRKGRVNSDECSIFDSPEDYENKPAKLIKVHNGEAQKFFTRCPHQQCGHIFETVNEVNHHILFQHVKEPAVLKETTACQYSPIEPTGTTSTGCDPVPELKNNLCSSCRGPVQNEQKKATGSISPSYSDVSADDAPTLVKEESFEKNDINCLGAPNSQNSFIVPRPSGANPLQNLSNSLTPRKIDASKAASNGSTPAPSSSTPLSNKQPKRSAITPNTGMNQSHQSQPMLPPNFGMSFAQPANAQQQLLNNQQFFALMNMVNSGAGLPTTPTVKAGGSITAGSSSFSNLPQTTVNLPGSSVGGIGIVHPPGLGALNGIHIPNTSTSASSQLQNDPLRHKIHELKTKEEAQTSNLSDISNPVFQQQQQRNASPNTILANVITSTNNIQRGQQHLPFVRPPSIASNPQLSFFQRMPGVLPTQVPPLMNHAQLSQIFGLGGIQPPGQMMPQQPNK